MKKDFTVTGYTWLKVPDDFTLVEQENWKTPIKKRFGAVRKIFLVVKRRSVHTQKGPILLERTLPEGADIKYERKLSVITKRVDNIASSVQRTISTKLASELSTRLNAQLGLFPVPVSAKVSGEVQSKISTEFTTSLTSELSGTQSFEVTNLDEFTSSVSLKTPSKQTPPQKYFFFLPVRLTRWDIYLYKQESLEFTYQSKWLIWNERQGEKYASQDLKVPLAGISFYEPQDDFPSFEVDPFEPDVTDAAEVTVGALNEACPQINYQEIMTLHDLAAAAFPATREEEEIRRAIRVRLPPKTTRKDRVVDNLFVKRAGGPVSTKGVSKVTVSRSGQPRRRSSPTRSASTRAAKKR